ncbi:MAG: FmdB family zinc ribbon protein [Thermoanaerobaculaceae bacterium]
MPLYEYACTSCGEHTEVVQKLHAAPLVACPRCGGAVRKVLAPPALQFKGSGWYVTDYGRGGNGRKAASQRDGEGKSSAPEGKSEASTTGENKNT